MLIGVFGISGVGKTTFAKAFVQQTQLGFEHLSASELISSLKGSVSPESLTAGMIKKNQCLLSKALKEHQKANPTSRLIIDLHTVIETPRGLVKVGKKALQALDIDVPVFIKASPANLLKRRENDTSKNRFQRPLDALTRLQQEAFEEFKLTFPNSYSFYINEPKDTENSAVKLSELIEL